MNLEHLLQLCPGAGYKNPLLAADYVFHVAKESGWQEGDEHGDLVRGVAPIITSRALAGQVPLLRIRPILIRKQQLV
jgi:hypothetical protein